jgi:hypothetical protein
MAPEFKYLGAELDAKEMKSELQPPYGVLTRMP